MIENKICISIHIKIIYRSPISLLYREFMALRAGEFLSVVPIALLFTVWLHVDGVEQSLSGEQRSGIMMIDN